jgi:hypothetical protein
MTELVITGSFVAIGQNLIRFAAFFKLQRRFGVIPIAVGMVLNRQFPIRAIDFNFRRGPGDLQHFVIVALFSHEQCELIASCKRIWQALAYDRPIIL